MTMIRIRFRFAYDRRVLVLLFSLCFSLLLAGSVVASDNPPRVQEEPTALLAADGGRHFYLTDANFATDNALTACADGYHTASLWEILDVSNMVYDYDHPDAHVKDDSGRGPPSFWYGWVRTGQDASGSATAGSGNCNNWTSTSSANSTVAVRLSRTWETAPGDIGPWDATSFTCNFSGPVWCVGEFGGAVYLPIIMKNFP
jgi:hypothetical protein